MPQLVRHLTHGSSLLRISIVVLAIAVLLIAIAAIRGSHRSPKGEAQDTSGAAYAAQAYKQIESGWEMSIIPVSPSSVPGLDSASGKPTGPVTEAVADAAAVGNGSGAKVIESQLAQVVGANGPSKNTYYWVVAIDPKTPQYPPSYGLGSPPSHPIAYNIDLVFVNAYTGKVYSSAEAYDAKLPSLSKVTPTT